MPDPWKGDPEVLAAALGIPLERAMTWAPWLKVAADRFEINTPKRLAAWWAQIGHESGGRKVLAESLNYNPAGLMATFNTSRITRFTKELAEQVGRTASHPANQPKIGSIAYGGRMGNAPAPSLDGYNFRGRGLIQVTGRDNYARCAQALNIDLLAHPELLEQPEHAALSAAWFWATHGCNELADAGNFNGCSMRIQGVSTPEAVNGLQERRNFWAKAKATLKIT